MEEKWVTQKELSTQLNVSKQVVQNWIKRGKIKSKLKYGVVIVDKTSITVKTHITTN